MLVVEELHKVETIMGIAGGEKKLEVILGALKGEHINVLITDFNTAEKLISS